MTKAKKSKTFKKFFVIDTEWNTVESSFDTEAKAKAAAVKEAKFGGTVVVAKAVFKSSTVVDFVEVK